MFVCSSYQSVPYLLAAQHWPPRSRRDPYWTFDLLLFSGWLVHSRTPGGIPIYTHQIQSNPQASINKTSTHTHKTKRFTKPLPKKNMQFTSFPIVYQKSTKTSSLQHQKIPPGPWRLRVFPPSEAKLTEPKPKVTNGAESHGSWQVHVFPRTNLEGNMDFNSQKDKFSATNCRDWNIWIHLIVKKQFLNNNLYVSFCWVSHLFFTQTFINMVCRLLIISSMKCHIKLLFWVERSWRFFQTSDSTCHLDEKTPLCIWCC